MNLDELETLLAKATVGPWNHLRPHRQHGGSVWREGMTIVYSIIACAICFSLGFAFGAGWQSYFSRDIN